MIDLDKVAKHVCREVTAASQLEWDARIIDIPASLLAFMDRSITFHLMAEIEQAGERKELFSFLFHLVKTKVQVARSLLQ